MSHSPRKFRLEEIVAFRGNRDCKIVKVENLENPFVVPLLMNCKHDNGELIVSSVPHAIQENGTFLIDLDKLANRRDVFADDNGVWIMKGSRSESYSVKKDADGQLVSLNKSQENADIIVSRRPYVSKSCPEYHKTMISIEYGQDIDKWYRILLLHYYFDGEPHQFTVAPHGNRTGKSTHSYIRTKESTKEKLAKNVADIKLNTKRALFQPRMSRMLEGSVELSVQVPFHEITAKQKLGLAPGSSKKSNNPLLAVLELRKVLFQDLSGKLPAMTYPPQCCTQIANWITLSSSAAIRKPARSLSLV